MAGWLDFYCSSKWQLVMMLMLGRKEFTKFEHFSNITIEAK
jgi:hypothetical protein